MWWWWTSGDWIYSWRVNLELHTPAAYTRKLSEGCFAGSGMRSRSTSSDSSDKPPLHPKACRVERKHPSQIQMPVRLILRLLVLCFGVYQDAS